MIHTVKFEIEEKVKGTWKHLGIDSAFQEFNTKPSDKVVKENIEAIIDRFNQNKNEDEPERRLVKIISCEVVASSEPEETTFRYECNECDWEGDTIEYDEDDGEICPDCGTNNVYEN